MKAQRHEESERDYIDRCAGDLADAHGLTPREHQMVCAILDGMRAREIAQRFGLTPNTVKWHLHNVFTKTATQTREELLRKALGLPLWRETLWPADAVARTLGATTSKAITNEPVH